MCAKSLQSCLTLCDPVDCSPPGFSVHGISQARILEWIAIPFSRGSSQPRDGTPVSCTAGRFFTVWTTGKSLSSWVWIKFCLVRSKMFGSRKHWLDFASHNTLGVLPRAPCRPPGLRGPRYRLRRVCSATCWAIPASGSSPAAGIWPEPRAPREPRAQGCKKLPQGWSPDSNGGNLESCGFPAVLEGQEPGP